jgi:hypothetical protein
MDMNMEREELGLRSDLEHTDSSYRSADCGEERTGS